MGTITAFGGVPLIVTGIEIVTALVSSALSIFVVPKDTSITVGESSLVIVVVIVSGVSWETGTEVEGLLRLRIIVSLLSNVVSPKTLTVIVLLSSPTPKLKVPDVLPPLIV